MEFLLFQHTSFSWQLFLHRKHNNDYALLCVCVCEEVFYGTKTKYYSYISTSLHPHMNITPTYEIYVDAFSEQSFAHKSIVMHCVNSLNSIQTQPTFEDMCDYVRALYIRCLVCVVCDTQVKLISR